MSKPLKYIAYLLLYFVTASSVSAQSHQVLSPDGKLTLTINLQPNGALKYSSRFNGEPIIYSSSLGLTTYNRNGWDIDDWVKDMEVANVTRHTVDTTWSPIYGERATIPQKYNELLLHLRKQDKERTALQLQVRAYNEGFAIRYFFPEKHFNGIVDISDEITQFTLPEGAHAWHAFKAQAEYHKVPLKDWKNEAETPLLIELPERVYMAIHEANNANYSRTRLKLVEENTLQTSMYDRVMETGPFGTPWRMVLVGETPGELIENNYLLLNLNDTNEIENTSWIKPGKVIREMTLSTDGAKACVDFAVDKGLDYVHFDAGWYGYEYVVGSDATTVTVDPKRNKKGDLDLQEAINYANDKGIGVSVYVNHRALERQMHEVLPLYKEWGIDIIKFGFVHVGSHRWNTWFYDAVRQCARHEIMVNVHDELMPTGYSRTYPNLMTLEGILGNEEMPDANHNATLPFTRYLAGRADYTISYGDTRIKNTRAHQLALAVVYYSPLQWMYWYDKPAELDDDEAMNFWKDVPTVWDDTKVLDGEIGEYIVTTRRKGEDWYLGAITNTESRTVEIQLDFLEEGSKYKTIIYADGKEAATNKFDVAITSKTFKAGKKLKIQLAKCGGIAIKFEKL